MSAAAQSLTNTGSVLTVQSGALLYVGPAGLANQTGATLTNAGALRVDGPLTNPGTLDLSTGTLEVRGDVTNAGTLRPGTSPVTFSGLSNQLLTPGGATLYQLLLNKPTTGANTLTLAGDLTVSNQLALTNGLILTQSGTTLSTLHLPVGANLSGEAAGRYVRGALQIIRSAVSGAAVDFGHGAVLNPTSNNLGTVSITRTAGLTSADVSYGQNLGATTRGIDRIWTISPAAQPVAAVQLTLSWLPDNDNGLTDFTKALFWQQTASGAPWMSVGAAASASTRSLSLNPTVLNRFTVSNAANPLPVTLLSFTAEAEGPAAGRLRWATAAELNNAGFTVERSVDARTFAAIGTVPGAGTSATAHDYTLLDNQLPAGITLLHYRLRLVDSNGDFTYSPVRSLARPALAAGFGVYPSRVPAGQAATYYYTGPAGPATLQVLDLLGRVLRTTTVDGRAQGDVPLAGLPTGTYLLRFTTATARFSGRCVVE